MLKHLCYLSEEIINNTVVEHWSDSVSGQTVAVWCSCSQTKPVPKEKPAEEKVHLFPRHNISSKNSSPLNADCLDSAKAPIQNSSYLTLKWTCKLSSALNMWDGGYQNERSAEANPKRLWYTGRIPGVRDRQHHVMMSWGKVSWLNNKNIVFLLPFILLVSSHQSDSLLSSQISPHSFPAWMQTFSAEICPDEIWIVVSLFVAGKK